MATPTSASDAEPASLPDSLQSSRKATGSASQQTSGDSLPEDGPIKDGPIEDDLMKARQPANARQTSASQGGTPSAKDSAEDREILNTFSPDALAQALATQLAISPNDWHRLSANRAVRAREQAAAALVYMLKDKPDEALPRLAQAIGWLDKTLKAPPCPSHGPKKQ